jgi:hypothetical protein
LCTAPKKYSVVETSGSVASKCCVDLVVRHKQPTIANCQIQDKLRIQVHEIGNNKVNIKNNFNHTSLKNFLQVSGKRDVITCLFSGKPEPEEKLRDAEHFEQLSLSGAPLQSNPLIARPGMLLPPFNNALVTKENYCFSCRTAASSCWY